MTKHHLSYIFFDVGGVIISDFSGTNRWNELLADMGVTDSNRSHFMQVWNSHKPRINLDYAIDSMVTELQLDVGLPLPDNFNFLDEFVKRFSANPSILKPLDTIRQLKLRAGLITNMYVGMWEKIQKAKILPEFSFDPIIDSSTVGLQKPDTAIFTYAQSLIKARSDELLFVDNLKKNTDAAARLGWNTFLYDTSDLETSADQLDVFIRQCVH